MHKFNNNYSINQVHFCSFVRLIVRLNTYSAKFFFGAVLEVLEEVAAALVLLERQLDHLGLARILLHAAAPRAAPCYIKIWLVQCPMSNAQCPTHVRQM